MEQSVKGRFLARLTLKAKIAECSLAIRSMPEDDVKQSIYELSEEHDYLGMILNKAFADAEQRNK